MTTRVFAERGMLKLVSDERDIMVRAYLHQQVDDWCRHTGIEVERVPYDEYRFAQIYFDVHLWRIKNEQHRMLFLLRWS